MEPMDAFILLKQAVQASDPAGVERAFGHLKIGSFADLSEDQAGLAQAALDLFDDLETKLAIVDQIPGFPLAVHPVVAALLGAPDGDDDNTMTPEDAVAGAADAQKPHKYALGN